MKTTGTFHAPEHDWRYEEAALKAERQESIDNPAPVRIAADWTSRANYQSQYAANNREAINAKKREWRKRTGKH